MADRGRSETVWKPAGNVEPVEPSPEAFFWKINFITTHHNRSLSSIDLWRSQGHVAIGRLETDWTFSVNVFSGRFPVSIKPGKDKALEALDYFRNISDLPSIKMTEKFHRKASNSPLE